MRKQFLILFISFGTICLADLGAQQSIVASGGNISSASGSVSYSIGQVNYISVKGEDGTISPGVQQAYAFTIVGIEDLDKDFSVSLYPNPTSSFVTLDISQIDKEFVTGTYSIRIYDMQGKCLYTQDVNQPTTTIPIHQFTEAIYVFQIWKNKVAVKSFELIKSN